MASCLEWGQVGNPEALGCQERTQPGRDRARVGQWERGMVTRPEPVGKECLKRLDLGAEEDGGSLLEVAVKPGQALGRLPSSGNGTNVWGEAVKAKQVSGPKPSGLEVRTERQS